MRFKKLIIFLLIFFSTRAVAQWQVGTPVYGGHYSTLGLRVAVNF